MRVIAGTRKGHTIAAPPGRDTRPTSDRVRESVFNLVGPLDGAAVLDLFAGSGALGIEALSRGAARAVFVERDPQAVRTIERNLDRLRLTGARVVAADAVTTLAPEVETVYVMASPQVSFVSSSGVKEIAAFSGDVSQLVPAPVARRLAELFPDGRPGTPERPGE